MTDPGHPSKQTVIMKVINYISHSDQEGNVLVKHLLGAFPGFYVFESS